MNLPIGNVNEPDEWALEIVKSMNAVEYYNPTGGIEFFNRQKYTDANIKLNFLKFNIQPYKQINDSFEPGLSVIDAMMFNSPEDINIMLDNFELL